MLKTNENCAKKHINPQINDKQLLETVIIIVLFLIQI